MRTFMKKNNLPKGNIIRHEYSEEVRDIVDRMPTRWAMWTALITFILIGVVFIRSGPVERAVFRPFAFGAPERGESEEGGLCGLYGERGRLSGLSVAGPFSGYGGYP